MVTLEFAKSLSFGWFSHNTFAFSKNVSDLQFNLLWLSIQNRLCLGDTSWKTEFHPWHSYKQSPIFCSLDPPIPLMKHVGNICWALDTIGRKAGCWSLKALSLYWGNSLHRIALQVNMLPLFCGGLTTECKDTRLSSGWGAGTRSKLSWLGWHNLLGRGGIQTF